MSKVEDLSKLRGTGYAYQSKELVDKYSPEALRVMERLWQDVASFHAPRYFLPEDSPLPSWLMDAVRDVPNQGVEGGWPQFARYWNPIDWPALIAEHPDEIGWDEPEYTAMYTELWDWGHREGLNPWFDVGLWISPEAKIECCRWSVRPCRVRPAQRGGAGRTHPKRPENPGRTQVHRCVVLSGRTHHVAVRLNP